MDYESFHSEKHRGKRLASSWDGTGSWVSVMPNHDDEIIFDDDCPEYKAQHFSEPVHLFNGRVIPPRKSPLDPIDPEVLAFIKSKSPFVQMEPHLLRGMPVFRSTLVPIKRLFDYLLADKTMATFLRDYPTVSRDAAECVLDSDSTLFYEAISKAIDSAAMPSSRPR